MTRHKFEYADDDAKLLRDPTEPSDFEKLRAKMKAEPLSATDKDKLMRRKRELEERVAHGMPTHTEMWKATEENVHKHLRWERANYTQIEELKHINRRLEPENPHAGRIEYLRKQGESDKLAKWL